MHQSRRSIVGLLFLAAIVVSCTDRPAPTEATRAVGRRAGLTACLSLGAITNLINTVFGAGGPNANSALAKLNTVASKLASGDTAGARAHARTLISFIEQKASVLADPSQVQALIDAIECFAGITSDSFLIFPTDQPQVLVTGDGQAGLKLSAYPVSEPTLITLTMLDTAASPLITILDQYPGYVEVTQQSSVAGANTLTGPVTVAVCPAVGIPDSIASRLRLGHQAAPGAAGFEITPPADASFLNCTGLASTASKLPGWVRSLASLIMPKPLYARVMFSGGVGGTAEEFSPFGPVDTELSFAGGVGGTAEEFIRAPESTDANKKVPTSPSDTKLKRRTMSTTESAVNIVVCDQADVGSALPAVCRPRVTLTTAKGTILPNVPVTWAIGQGGGQTAVDDPTTRTCGTFGATALSTTNANGKAGACWTLGDVAGINTLVATPGIGGPLPAGVTFSPASRTFTAEGLKKQAVLTLGALSQTYTGTAASVTVTTTPADLATVNVTYDGSATAPTAAGRYAVVATLDNPSWQGSTSDTLVIAASEQAPVSLSGGNSVTVAGTTAALSLDGGSGTGGVTFDAGSSTACSVTGAGVVSATHGTGTCVITGTKAGDGNYLPATTAAFVITVNKGAASIALDNLNQTYDGSPKSATATTTPTGLATVAITYDASATAPTNAGNYAVVATLTNDDYQASDAVGTLVIAKGNQPALSVTGAASATFAGGTVFVGTSGGAGTGGVSFATSTPAACSVNTTTGEVGALIGTGSCIVTAMKAGDANWNPATSPAWTIGLLKAGQSITFGALGAKTYGDAAFPVSATTSSGLAVSFAAAAGSSCSVSGILVSLTGAGTCTVIASQGGDADFYNAAPSVSRSFSIAKRGATATAGSATINFGTAVPSIPCTVSGLLGGDAGAVTCATPTPVSPLAGSYTLIPTVSPADPANYAMSLVNGTLTVVPYTQVGCFASPIYSVMPTTKSYQRKGSNVPVKCTLTTAQGVAVMNANGNLLVQDMGADGTTVIGTAFAGTNVFKVSNGGNYAYGLDTSPTGFVSTHYYRVTATWTDGSVTTGWFYIR